MLLGILLLLSQGPLARSLPALSPLVVVSGRAIPSPPTALAFDWVGVAARVRVLNNFTFITATITDLCAGGNKFIVRLAAEGFTDLDVASFYTRAGTHEYNLFGDAGRANFVGSDAELTLIKAVEARFTMCDPVANHALVLQSFDSDAPFLPPAARTRRLEVLGDSITAGDLVYCADKMGAHFSPANALWADNHAQSYGSRLCSALGAECSTIAWGGMGLIQNDVRSWTWPTIPVVYESALAYPVIARGPGAPLDYPWDFKNAPPPDGVIINLGCVALSPTFTADPLACSPAHTTSPPARLQHQ